MTNVSTKAFREAAFEEFLHQFDLILVRLNHPESGRIAETMIQLLPDGFFTSLRGMMNGYESDDITKGFANSLAIRIAQKVGMTWDGSGSGEITDEAVVYGASSILALVYCENLRRKGYMEYSWQNDIFTLEPSDPGFTTLTESGHDLANLQKLELYESKTIH